MCGICGIFNLDNKPVQEVPVRKMMSKMKHRGPDDEGTFIKENIGLGFVRLSIIDLSYAGHQPMISGDGRYVIVFNGEIFNYLEIRNKLKESYSFRSGTDTEVLLAAYLKWGEGCLEMLNGMFAFIILDTLKMEIFGARDRFGIKPFYYTLTENSLIFASDIPPILSVLDESIKAESSIIYDFLQYNRTNHTNLTFFRNIYKLQHGHQIKLINNKVSVERWYNLEEKVLGKTQGKYSSEKFAMDFSHSIDLQLRSDVPIGTCLSGGIDSSAITSVMKSKSTCQDLHTFSAIYGRGQRGDESEFIELYENSGITMHSVNPTASSLLNDLERFNEALSEPLPNTSEYAEFKVMELAKDYCTVILNGQGADELMAGYHYFYGYFFKDLLKQLRFSRFSSELVQYINLHKSWMGIKSLGFAVAPDLFKNRNSRWLNIEFADGFSKTVNPIVENFYNSKSLQEFLIKHFEYKFEHHLLWADKSGMYFSLETRFPFLDHNLVENTLASGITIDKGWTKSLLRDAMRGVLPEKIVRRTDKIGYLTPEMDWFSDKSFKEYFLDIMNSDKSMTRGFLNKSNLMKSLEEYHKSGKYNSEFWKWLSLEMWFRRFID